MRPVEQYLHDLNDIHRAGAAVKETSYYGTLEHFLNEIGKTLKPKVRCIINIQNTGAGIPDGGLFSADQFEKGSNAKPLPGQIPSRGAMEVKGTSEDVWKTAKSAQVAKYLSKYGQVLVTNYRDFVLVGKDASGNPIMLESYHLGSSETDFWALAANPRNAADEHDERLVEYLKRVMLHPAPLADPKDVAWFLASYAREAKARIEGKNLPALDTIRATLEEALGLKFEGTKGERFFRATLVQTLFYGVFSAWVLWSKEHAPSDQQARFDWRVAAWSLHVPMIRVLFEQVATPSKLEALKLTEVLDWTASTLNRVDRAAFFTKFEEGRAVQYFYEPFLEAFDPVLRKELGVWYTPPEIVQYMVARVDTVLREELAIEDGLADSRVLVIDPCCGTGTYLLEVLKRITQTLREKGEDALLGSEVKRAAMQRVYGFEILPAPFVVAHLQLGLLLQNLGAPFADDKNERAGIYLTNALTGWEKTNVAKQPLPLPEFAEERDRAEKVKQDEPILVILGNPPYNAFAGVSPKEEQGLVEPYKEGLISEWVIKKFNLDDLYVRFFRLAERRIAEMTGKGIVCYISNHSWVKEPSYVVLRKRLLESFDRFWIENMHGNRKISEYAPDGRTSETIFAVPGFSIGIKQGIVISLWSRSGKKHSHPQVLFRDDIDAAKAVERRTQLLESLKALDFDSHYQAAAPDKDNRFSFRPLKISPEYLTWPKVVDLCGAGASNGLMEKRGGALIDIDRSALEKRMQMYYNRQVDWDTLKALGTGLTEDAARFDAKKARTKVLAAEKYQDDHLRRYAIRPFDTRWCYYTAIRPLWNEPRPSLWAQCWDGNSFLLSRMNAAKDPEGPPFYFVRGLSDDHLLAPDATCFPLRLRSVTALEKKEETKGQDSLFERPAIPSTSNLSAAARTYLSSLGLAEPDADASVAELIWMHALAIGYSPLYLSENADGIQQNWPRIPLPDSKDRLLDSARLGQQIAALLDTEAGVLGVTTGKLRSELQHLATISRVGGGTLNPDAGDLALTTGWGYRGDAGIIMPGKGKAIERDYTPDEMDEIKAGASVLGLTIEQALQHLGQTTYDVYLNEIAYWKNIPAKVWDYTIGGYQVIKKWLSYREQGILQRPLTIDEAREVMNMARRIGTILLLEPLLDANYLAVKTAAYSWPVLENQQPAMASVTPSPARP